MPSDPWVPKVGLTWVRFPVSENVRKYERLVGRISKIPIRWKDKNVQRRLLQNFSADFRKWRGKAAAPTCKNRWSSISSFFLAKNTFRNSFVERKKRMLVEVMIGRVCERDKEKERVRMDGWMDGWMSFLWAEHKNEA